MNIHRLRRIRIGIVAAILPAIVPNAFGDYSVEKELQRFQQDPKSFMKSRVPKFEQVYQYGQETEEGEQEGQLIGEQDAPPISVFTQEQIQQRDFVDIKNGSPEGQRSLSRISPQGRAAYVAGDLAGDLVEGMARHEMGLKLTKLEKMTRLTSAQVKTPPWSDDYWPIYTGGAAKRYADESFRASKDWQANANYTFAKLSTSVDDDASPAEKYDLLVGDPNFSLSKAMLDEGRGYADATFDPVKGYSGGTKQVETWMGHCHGWAPAAYMLSRPKNDITLTAVNGMKIKFYPSDIKALATLNWAKSAPNARFVGSRCTEKNPKTDENGRVIDQKCFDTNPGTWHLAVVNQVGVNRKSFTIDATFDYEVWNQPVYAYSYTYFNVMTNKETSNLKEAMVERNDPGFKDIFAKYRSDKAKNIVGVAMKLTYIAETAPTHDEKDNASRDRKVSVNYLYDLELDEAGTIIGGEWRHESHPDFLWTFNSKDKAKSHGDLMLDRARDKSAWHFNMGKPVPASWSEQAIKTSSPKGEPLARIVDGMIFKSSRGLSHLLK